MSWADVVVSKEQRVRKQAVPVELLDTLDDSKDGINLMLKQHSLLAKQRGERSVNVLGPESKKSHTQDSESASTPTTFGSSWRDVLAADSGMRKRGASEISRAVSQGKAPVGPESLAVPKTARNSPFRKQGKTDGSPHGGPVSRPPQLVLPDAHVALASSSWADEVDGEDLASEVESWMGLSASGSETDRLSHPSQLPKQPVEELTPARIAQREKQISFGKATDGYKNYVLKVKIEDRGEDTRKYPVTPRTDEKISKRSFDYKLKKWRRALHRWDPVPVPKRIKSSPLQKKMTLPSSPKTDALLPDATLPPSLTLA
ncbi:Histone RNA hairpin-binding protein, putative [Hondaea fermentalgiana]|uniref:Histone RNA hairpin-binding protein, putative n=1 Tax=Hondaea fermentalgiana TaxID=2315210 RepID=A0A2R5GEL1_9STRA|nr:Histone RNA hairpin-binding protein, putative [Hondaea fermentalgiana]|eukprot:GBG29005.1 Histone RNA hairpin-binding protein, putative [Hondaea fermentalgiana]